MKSKRVMIFLVVILGACTVIAAQGEKGYFTNHPTAQVVEPTAHSLALETAGAFTADNFRIRESEWRFTLEKGIPVFLKMTLFAGNHYRFVTASPTAGAKICITFYDGKGHPIKAEPLQDTGVHAGTEVAAGIAPELSGQYFVGVELLENSSDLPLDCSLVMAYK